MSRRSEVPSPPPVSGRSISGSVVGLTVAALLVVPGTAAAQVSGLALPPVAADSVEVPSADRQLQLLRDAREATRAGEFRRASTLWEQVVGANPYLPEAWLQLAEARGETGDARGGMAALRRALELGPPVERDRILFRVAEVMAAAGQTEMALDWLRRALAAGFGERSALARSPAFSGLRGTAAFDSIQPEAPPPEDRVAGWRHDIRFFVEEARRMHASPERPARSGRFEELADSLRAAVPGFDDDAVTVGLTRVAASLGDGHTWVAPIPAGPESGASLEAGFLPVRLYAFRDGVYVVDARGDAKRWIGARVTAVGGRPTDEVVRDLAPFVSRDNPMGLRSTGVDLYLRHTAFLREVGATDSLGAATLTLSDDAGTRRVTLAAGTHRFDRALPAPPDTDGPAPLWLSDPGTAYRMERLPEEGALYVQINSIRDRDDGPGLEQFARLIRDSLEATGDRGLVLDLRWNGGGDNSLIRPLVRQLVGWETSGPGRTIAVIAGRHTFSAAQNLANRLERWTGCVFVGEPTGSRPNMTGERTNVALPWSGLRASIANRYWQDSDPGDDRIWIAPDVRVEPTAADYFTGRDPVLAAALDVVSGAE